MLKDYYEIIAYGLKPRPVVMENIENVINWGDSSYGDAMYGCRLMRSVSRFELSNIIFAKDIRCFMTRLSIGPPLGSIGSK